MAEDAAMETCPSPEMGDSRKRPLDSDPENEQSKRSHFSSGKSCITFSQSLSSTSTLSTTSCSLSLYLSQNQILSFFVSIIYTAFSVITRSFYVCLHYSVICSSNAKLS